MDGGWRCADGNMLKANIDGLKKKDRKKKVKAATE